MKPTAVVPATFLATLSIGCLGSEAPTVELVNGAGKSDDVSLSFTLDAGHNADFHLDCTSEPGCDISFLLSAGPDAQIDITLRRPDGFSRTDALFANSGVLGTAFFGQEPGFYTATVSNVGMTDEYMAITAAWVEARPDTGAPVGAACSDDTTCESGQVCLGAGDGQSGFCSSSCSELGQLRCDESDSYCVPVNEALTEGYCFNSCEVDDDCGGGHLECHDGLCVPSAEPEMSEE